MRTMPPRSTIRHDAEENHAWFGRAAALVNEWAPIQLVPFNLALRRILITNNAIDGTIALRELLTLLHRMRAELQMQVRGPMSIVVGTGMVFDYFDEVRKVIARAREDVLFVDPYLDSDFVSRYLPHIAKGVAIRLLTRERLATLLPAVETFSRQTSASVEVRAAEGFHDRYVFVDQQACYQSGASFKDGGRNAPTTLTQITDALESMKDTYQRIWMSATIQS